MYERQKKEAEMKRNLLKRRAPLCFARCDNGRFRGSLSVISVDLTMDVCTVYSELSSL